MCFQSKKWGVMFENVLCAHALGFPMRSIFALSRIHYGNTNGYEYDSETFLAIELITFR